MVWLLNAVLSFQQQYQNTAFLWVSWLHSVSRKVFASSLDTFSIFFFTNKTNPNHSLRTILCVRIHIAVPLQGIYQICWKT